LTRFSCVKQEECHLLVKMSAPERLHISSALLVLLFAPIVQAFALVGVTPVLTTTILAGSHSYVHISQTIDPHSTLLYSAFLPVEAVSEPEVTVEQTSSVSSLLSSTTTPENAFEAVASHASFCLLQSDVRRDAVGKPQGTQASSATNWINDASAFVLQKALDKAVSQVTRKSNWY
jgi:hypothetical protein